MMNTVFVTVVALLINAWADDGSYTRSNWPHWVWDRLLPLACIASLVLLMFWRRENLACRALFRAAVITVLACLINIFPFVLNGLNPYGNVQSTQLESRAIVSKGPTLLESVLAIFQSSKPDAEQEEAEMQSRYLTALSRCIDERSHQHLSYKVAKSECIANATKIGQSAFILRYSGL
jgi:hypothetical protein